MSAHGQTLEMELPADNHTPPLPTINGLLGRVGQGLMKRLRHAAWSVLDLQTEFEPLD